MAKRDDDTIGGTEGGTPGGIGGNAPVNLSEFDAVADAARRDGAAGSEPGKRRRRTRAELEAAGYYTEGKGDKPAAKPASQKGSPLSQNSIQFALTGIHALLAAGLHAPEMELSETEAATVSNNIVAVARHYDLQQTQKATDIGNLAISLGIVYGGRAIRISSRVRSEQQMRRARSVGLNAVAAATAPQPAQAPQTVKVAHPNASGPPAGAMPPTRPKTADDNRLLDEVEAYVG
jgi:hypothetical protein